MTPIRVILADDHRMFREALRVPLEAETDIAIIGESSTGEETLSILTRICPDVLLLDIGLHDINGIDVARKVAKLYPAVRVIALSGYADRLYIEEMLKAGARGYVVKSAGADELISAIRAVAAGHSFLSQEATQVMIQRIQDDAKALTPPPSVISPREREVLCRLANGFRAAEIAARMGITVSTVEVHRRNIKRKLGLHTTAELTRYAMREGLVSAYETGA
ncbi:response regulator [Magnetospirillum fulvum]|uniref:Response regulator n=1 Tax=Magnetospirillum fulvum MGU-K5 TaxID=1316936 RepID=S9SDB8_MAGFU|nr:response regulator transcription factor [Magnetospirillum fulvum]EPY02058.1 response regulator [Magnetospirillum fulvum MGU-K5]